MSVKTVFKQSFRIKGGDFMNAGSVSIEIKKILKELGLKPDIIYRAAVCCYEAEMNSIMYANDTRLDFSINADEIILKMEDSGPGIENIEQAMQEGYSTATEEMREMGFGAGMGLPNIKKNSDEFKVESEVSKGTKQTIKIFLN